MLLPGVDRLGADPQPLGYLAHRVTPILNLSDRIALELVCEFGSGNLVLLASAITRPSPFGRASQDRVKGNPVASNFKLVALAEHTRPGDAP